MPSHSEVIDRWVSLVTGSDEKRSLRGANVFADYAQDRISTTRVKSAEVLYSYGRHFELARFIGKPGSARAFFLLNGDTYSVTTTRHQSDVRSAVNRSGYPVLIAPHTALASAGIELDSIVPVDISAERNETTNHTVEFPELAALIDSAAEWAPAEARLLSPHNADHSASSASKKLIGPDGATYTIEAYTRAYDYDAQQFANYDPPKVSYYRNGNGLSRLGTGLTTDDGTLDNVALTRFMYQTYRHFLGAATFRAKVKSRRRIELATVGIGDDSAEAAAIRAAMVDGLGWRRVEGGTIRSADAEGGRLEVWTQEKNIERTARFISAFDSNESWPHYFLAELPRDARPTTVDEAIEALKPAEVVAFESDRARDESTGGIDSSHLPALKRQGDIFAIPAQDVANAKPIPFRHTVKKGRIPLDGSGRHYVSELVKLSSPDGRTVEYFGQGMLRHDSDRYTSRGTRAGTEHAAVKLGPIWHKLVRNTVPLSNPSDVDMRDGAWSRNRANGASPRAWSIIGSID